MTGKTKEMKGTPPAQEQAHQPGKEYEMRPTPSSQGQTYMPAGKLKGKIALITGGDSGIGRAIANCFAQEGADLFIAYLEESKDMAETMKQVGEHGGKCHALSGDVGRGDFCRQLVEKHVQTYGRIDVLINNAAEQHAVEKPEDISDEQLHRTFQTNIFSMFYLVRAALPHMPEGSCIINTTSVTAYDGHKSLIDYSATKGAIVAFTRSLSAALVDRGIRVNGVAPGPIWTPLIPASFPAEKVEQFGSGTPMGRPGQPDEVAPCYVFLASEDSSYMTGQVLHPNGGRIVGS